MLLLKIWPTQKYIKYMVIRLMLGATLPEIYKRALKPPTLERITHFMKQKYFCNCPSLMATKRFVFFTIIIIIILCHPQPYLLTRPFPTLVPKATLAIITSLKTKLLGVSLPDIFSESFYKKYINISL